jgi:acyl carrier protein
MVKDTRTHIVEFLGGYFKDYRPADDEDIFMSGYVNSLFVMQLIRMVEQDFDLTVDDEDLDFENFRTVEAIVAFIARKKAVPAGP